MLDWSPEGEEGVPDVGRDRGVRIVFVLLAQFVFRAGWGTVSDENESSKSLGKVIKKGLGKCSSHFNFIAIRERK